MKASNAHKGPPSWAIRFFRWYCNEHLAEAVLGDMLELYRRRYSALGKFRADALFLWNVVQFFQPFAFRKKTQYYHINQLAMFQNYFKVAWRTMSRQKMYTFIKIGGFALGLATCMLIAIFVRNELRYDRHYKHTANIYRVYNEFHTPEILTWTAEPAPFAQILKDN